MNSPVKEMQYLEQFAALAMDSYGPGEWSRVEEVFRAVWPQTGYGMAFERALAVVAERWKAVRPAQDGAKAG